MMLGSASGAYSQDQARDSVEDRAQAESGSEWWYVLRGRANMKIGNYRAAIEAYEKAAELNPNNREALKRLGIANERQGLTTRAIESFDRYLAKFNDDPEIAFKQADLLGWERYAYRRSDAIRYYRMGLARQEDLERRHRLARLLAQERSDLDEALVEYRILVDAAPEQEIWRAEYRELLLWDERHLDEAIREFRRLEKKRPGDFEVELRLAELVARKNPRSDEAASRHAALVARRPKDVSLRLAYAELLAREPRRRDLAIAEYRKLLEQAPKPATREALADLLSARDETRAEALAHYEVLLRERPDAADLRLKTARLLGGRREDAEAAIAQYERVVDMDPENAEAHAGLAQAYAWTGDRDKALYHSNRSARYGTTGREVSALREDLLRGREPRLIPIVRGLLQEGGSKVELRGVTLAAAGRADLTPFLTLQLETGFEDYWRSGDNAAAGYLELDTELRLDPTRRVELGLGYHSLSGGSRDVLARVAYTREHERWSWRAGFERKLRFDSFAALVGERIAGERIGAARENRFYARFETTRGRLEGRIEPYVGWVGARDVSDNPFVGMRGRVAWRLFEIGAFHVSPVYSADIHHYRDDFFGVDPVQRDPEPGGYFSPQLFVEQVPGLALGAHWGERHFLELEGGPSLQHVRESGTDTRFEIGGHARFSYVTFLRESIYWTLEARFFTIGDAYTRAEANTSLTFKF